MSIETVPSPLLDRVAELRRLREREQRHRELGGLAAALQTQRDELRQLLDLARPLVAVWQLFSGHVPVRGLAVERLRALRDKLSSAAGAASTSAALAPGELAEIRSALESTRQALLASWQTYLSAPLRHEEMVPALARFAPFRDTAEQVQENRRRLQQLAERLPASQESLEQAQNLREQMAAALRQVDALNLDPEAREFLHRCGEGYPLAELLAKPALLDWLRSQGLLDPLRVRSG